MALPLPKPPRVGGRLPSASPVRPHRPGPRGDRLLARLRAVAALDGVTLTVGLQGRGGAPGDRTDDELVVIGRAHEFGIGVPERPWLRSSLARNSKVWAGGLKVAVKQRAQGHLEASTLTLRQVGVVMADDTRQTIADGPWTPNSPKTIQLKGSSKPLIDTAQMIQSVRAAIEGPGLPVEIIG